MRTVRMLAVDPMMSTGQRIHTLGWSDPEHILSEFVRGLNYGAGANEFQPDPAGIFYSPTVPYRPVPNIYTPYQESGDSMTELSGDDFSQRHQNNGPWPYETSANIGGLSMIENPSWAGFDIKADRNAGKFDILIWFAPGAAQNEGRYNGLAESYAVWPTGREQYSLNGGRYSMDGLNPDKPFMILYSNMTRGVGELTHSFMHASFDAGILLQAFNWDGYHPQRDHNIQSILTPTDLFLTYDTTGYERGIKGEAHCGTTHFLPNSSSDYDYNNPATVPSNAHMWLTYPEGNGWNAGQLDLSNPNRLGTFGPVDDHDAPELASFEEGHRPYLWQLRHLPRQGNVRVDGRNCDWWQYIMDLNYQEGFGQPVTPPILGAVLPPTPPPVPPQPVPPTPDPTPAPSPVPAIDPIVTTAMNQNGDSASGPTDDPNLHITAGTKGLYFSRDDLHAVAFIAWTASEIVPQ